MTLRKNCWMGLRLANDIKIVACKPCCKLKEVNESVGTVALQGTLYMGGERSQRVDHS